MPLDSSTETVTAESEEEQASGGLGSPDKDKLSYEVVPSNSNSKLPYEFVQSNSNSLHEVVPSNSNSKYPHISKIFYRKVNPPGSSYQQQDLFKDKNKNRDKICEIFREMIENDNRLQVFTDGSKDGCVVSCAVILPELTVLTRLKDFSKSSEGEEFAIALAIFIIDVLYPKGGYVINTDAQSALPKFAIEENQDIKEEEKQNCAKTVEVRWILGHCGIPGNEEADWEAKNARKLGDGKGIDIVIYFKDIIPVPAEIFSHLESNLISMIEAMPRVHFMHGPATSITGTQHEHYSNVRENPSPQSIEFLGQSYTVHEVSQYQKTFYSHNSSFVHGGVEKPGEEQPPITGQQDIYKKMMSLNFRDYPVTHQVQVTGELSNNGQPMQCFMKTFELVPNSPKKYTEMQEDALDVIDTPKQTYAAIASKNLPLSAPDPQTAVPAAIAKPQIIKAYPVKSDLISSNPQPQRAPRPQHEQGEGPAEESMRCSQHPDSHQLENYSLVLYSESRSTQKALVEEYELHSKAMSDRCDQLEKQRKTREKQRSEKKVTKLETNVNKLSKSLEEERELNKWLQQNQEAWRKQVASLEAQLQQRDELETEVKKLSKNLEEERELNKWLQQNQEAWRKQVASLEAQLQQRDELETEVKKLSKNLEEERELNKSLQQNQEAWRKKVASLEAQLQQRDELETEVKKLSKSLEEERELNKWLQQNQEHLQKKVASLEAQLQQRDEELRDSKEQLNDMMVHLDAQQKLANTTEVTQQEIQDGNIVLGAAAQNPQRRKKRNRKR